MSRHGTVLAALLVLFPTVALAQGDRERGDRACRGDVQRLCRKVLNQGDMVILQCLQTNRPKLSRACSNFLREVGQLQ
jgi:hypothetical protein